MLKDKKTPEIRFKGFTEDWEQRKLEEICNRFDNLRVPVAANQREKGNIPYYGANGIQDYVKGFTHKGEFILIAEDGANDLKNYPVNYVNGLFWANNHVHVLQSKEKIGNNKFLKFCISRTNIEHLLVGGGRAKLNSNIMMNMDLKIPAIVEQEKIGNILFEIDNLITLHQRKCDKLLNFKKSMLEKMFPKNSSNFPEIRFKGFTDAWEQRKFGNCVTIQRGGSPRPIENFITSDDKIGINWVKIGDVKPGERYIYKTNEKIIPEGVKHSREVFKGDLILSNSMSFGRPYIMGTNGCIHDGWLLIRDDKNLFDKEYLLQVLSSNYMLNQYKKLASGGVVNNLNSELVQNTIILLPKKEEQIKLGNVFQQIDNLITLHQLKEMKRS